MSQIAKVGEEEAGRLFPSPYRLKGYQLAGLNWAWLLWSVGCDGILADEMGLGKTVQAAALLSLLQSREGISGPHIILAPVSVLANWERELNAWCPHLRVMLYTGALKTRCDVCDTGGW